MTNLATILTDSTEKYADNVALRMDDITLTYAQLDDFSSRMATFLGSLGVEQGDRVALMLPNIPTFPVIYFGALRMGAVVVPMNPLFKSREVEYYLKDSGAKAIFALPGEAEKGAEKVGVPCITVGDDGLLGTVMSHEPTQGVVDKAKDDTAVILYTSGTTGRPKGAELTHFNLFRNQEVSASSLLEITPNDVMMGCLPLFHVFGMTCAMNTAISTGAQLTMLPRFEPVKALEMLGRDKVTIFSGVPTMYGALLAAAAEAGPDGSEHLRVCISGGASLPVELMRQFEDTFKCIILEGYGLSETSPVASFNHPHVERKPGSIGTPILGVEMKLVSSEGDGPVPVGDIGEIAIRGENIMKGYWQRPDATDQVIRNGWFHSGDLARQDDDGYFFIVDRTKDMIIRGGYNVYPREIEEVLYEHPAVAEAAVIGVPDDKMGEEVAAYVVLGAGKEATPDELREYTKERIAAYKYPRQVFVIDELPKGATGKILKRELRESH